MKARGRFALITEEFLYWAAQQDFNRQFLCFVFIRRLLPRKLIWVQLPDRPNDFEPCLKRLEAFAINDMNLRAAAELIGEFLEGWLEIIFAKENAGQL